MKILLIIIIGVILLFIVFICLVFPNKKREIPAAKAYSHRGLHGGQIPENSISAFKMSAEKGYGAEFDVQLTKDKKLVVFHDDSLLRMTGAESSISDLSYDELQEFRLKDTEEKIPLLREVLSTLAGVPILCEIKKQGSNTNTEICSYVASELDGYSGDICIESFSPFILRWFKKNRPDFARGQLSADFIKNKGDDLRGISAFFMTHMLLNFLSRPDFIAYRFTDTSAGLRFCKKAFRTPVFGWTARGDKERELCRSLFEGEIFEETKLINDQQDN